MQCVRERNCLELVGLHVCALTYVIIADIHYNIHRSIGGSRIFLEELWEPERTSIEGFGSRRGTKRHKITCHMHINNMK